MRLLPIGWTRFIGSSSLTTYHLPVNRDSVSYYGNQLLRFAQQEQDLKYQGLAYDLLGKNAIRQGRIGEAALLIKSDIAIWKQIGSQADLAEVYNLQGVVFSYLGQLDSALLQYQAALEIRYEMKDSAQASGLLSNMANIYQQTGDMAQSQTYNEKALALALACGDSPYEGNIRYNLANCYQFFRKYAAAMEQHVQAIAIAEAREDFKSTVLSMLSLANVYVAIKEYTKVAAYLEQALALALEKDLYAEQVYAYVRLGDYYFDQKVYEKAQESFSQGLAIAEEQGISYLIYDAKVSLGKLHVFWEELTSAEPYLLPIITSDAETVDIESWVEAHLEMGKLRILQSRWTEALSYASTGFEYAKDAELQVIQSALAKELTRIYRQLGRYEDAIHMYDTHLALRDSLDKDEAIRDILRIEYQADYEKQSL
ncbi:MAG: tetratricopeptide repeat protein [Bacteroidota bacterium]